MPKPNRRAFLKSTAALAAGTAVLRNAHAFATPATGTTSASDPSSTRIDAEVRALPVVVRASPHYYNTEAEIERLIAHLADLAPR